MKNPDMSYAAGIAREMAAALASIGWACDALVETATDVSFVTSKPATADRKGNRVPPRTERRSFDARGTMTVTRL